MIEALLNIANEPDDDLLSQEDNLISAAFHADIHGDQRLGGHGDGLGTFIDHEDLLVDDLGHFDDTANFVN